nr:MAG TPA: hypothetical protein [Caudoviricetes sp.]
MALLFCSKSRVATLFDYIRVALLFSLVIKAEWGW